MGRGRKRKASPPPCDYETLRNARMLENQARLESLGLLKTVSDLRQQVESAKPKRRHCHKRVYGLTPIRRSQRINASSTATAANNGSSLPPRRSLRLRSTYSAPPLLSRKQGKVTSSEGEEEEVDEIRPANSPLIKFRVEELQISPEASARRCDSKGRGSVYNPILGICCHFCRQKKLCGEEDCKRCGNFDVDEPCLGKTDCSVCHSSNGVYCRACLKVRYGEGATKFIATAAATVLGEAAVTLVAAAATVLGEAVAALVAAAAVGLRAATAVTSSSNSCRGGGGYHRKVVVVKVTFFIFFSISVGGCSGGARIDGGGGSHG